MLGLRDDIGTVPEKPLTVVGIGAHADDLEIGCGGSILRLIAERPFTVVHWLTLSGDGTNRESEARKAANEFLEGAQETNVQISNFRDGYFPFKGADIKDYFENNFKDVRPDLVFAHAREDRHQDHRVVSDLAWNTFRENATIVEYEIPKWDGDLGKPNTYVTFSDVTAHRKAELLVSNFPSQRDKSWYDEETFLGLMRIRGVEAGSRYAEAFTCRKLIW